MPQLSRHGSWLLAALCLAGCQTGRVARPPHMPQARNTPPPRTAPDSATQAQNTRPAPQKQRPAEFPPAPIATTKEKGLKEPELIIRATAPVPGEGPETSVPVPEPQPVDGVAKVFELHRVAVAKDAGIRDYVARFRRREVVNGKQLPEDVLLFRHLKEPNSLYFKWLPGTQCEGRELIYVQGKYRNQLQIKTGKGDLLAGIRTELDPHSERATANCRRTIDDAGLSVLIRRLGESLRSTTRSNPEAAPLEHVGTQQRPECRTPMECVVQRIPAGTEKYLPGGGARYWYFCTDERLPECSLPTLVITLDEQRREVEYYCFDRFNINIGLRVQDFDPNTVWGNR